MGLADGIVAVVAHTLDLDPSLIASSLVGIPFLPFSVVPLSLFASAQIPIVFPQVVELFCHSLLEHLRLHL